MIDALIHPESSKCLVAAESLVTVLCVPVYGEARTATLAIIGTA